jgi:hypothetical protein
LQGFLNAAGQFDAKPQKVAAWNAKYADSDLRFLIRQKKLPYENDRQMVLHFYPSEITKHEDFMGNIKSDVVKQMDSWFANLAPLIEMISKQAELGRKLLPDDDTKREQKD